MIQGHVGFMLVGVQVSPSALDFEGLVEFENLRQLPNYSNLTATQILFLL
jgi:hypothetical protein